MHNRLKELEDSLRNGMKGMESPILGQRTEDNRPETAEHLGLGGTSQVFPSANHTATSTHLTHTCDAQAEIELFSGRQASPALSCSSPSTIGYISLDAPIQNLSSSVARATARHSSDSVISRCTAQTVMRHRTMSMTDAGPKPTKLRLQHASRTNNTTENHTMSASTVLAEAVAVDHLPVQSTLSAADNVFALQNGLYGNDISSSINLFDAAQALSSATSKQTSLTYFPSTFSTSTDSNSSVQTMDFILFRPSIHWPDSSPDLSMHANDLITRKRSVAFGRVEAQMDLYKEGYQRQLKRSRRLVREKAELSVRIEALERLHIASLADQAKLHSAALRAQSLMNEAKAYAREAYERNMQLEGRVLSMEYQDRLNKLAMKDHTRVRSRLESTTKQLTLAKNKEEHESLMLQAHLIRDEEAEYVFAVLGSLECEKSEQIKVLQGLVKQGCTAAGCESWEKQFAELHEHQKSLERDRKDLQRQTWTQKHLLDEAGRAREMSQQMHQKTEEQRVLAVDQLKRCQIELRAHKTVSQQIVADYMRRLAEKEQEVALLSDEAKGNPTAGGLRTQHCIDLARQVATARAAQTALEREVEAERHHRAESEEKLAASEKHAKMADAEMLKMEMDLHQAQEDISTVRETNRNLVHQLTAVASQADLWQTISEAKLIDLQPESMVQHEQYIVQDLRHQLAELGDQLSDTETNRDRYRTERDDLRYDVSLYQRCAAQTYEPAGFKWFEKWVDAFVEAQVLKTQFAQELADNPLEIPKVPVTHEDFLTASRVIKTSVLSRSCRKLPRNVGWIMPVVSLRSRSVTQIVSPAFMGLALPVHHVLKCMRSRQDMMSGDKQSKTLPKETLLHLQVEMNHNPRQRRIGRTSRSSEKLNNDGSRAD